MKNIKNNGAVNGAFNVATNALGAINKSMNTFTAPVTNVINKTMTNISEPIAESLNVSLEQSQSPFLTIPIILGLGVLIVAFIIVIIFREQISLGLDIAWNRIKSAFGYGPEPSPMPIPANSMPEESKVEQSSISKILPGKKQVFNIAVDKYTYSDAEPLCKAFGAELATYDQVKEAWEKGADWCNYGWVKGQAAVFPTQKETFEKLQAGPEDQRMACGITGVNGGYFDNPELRFGVNCYGEKPSESDNDVRKIMADSGDLTPGALEYDRKVYAFKQELSEIPVNPFKTGGWSE
jgi:hypothetical protein